jgi:hypothetical protein
MKSTQSSDTRPVHQTVAEPFEIKTGRKTIAIGFRDQRLSPHAGSATFWGWLRGGDWLTRLGSALPHSLPLSNNNLLPLEKALAFMHGLLCDARKLTHVAYLRRDPVVPELLGVRRVASQSVLSRFFAGFDSAGTNLRCFRSLWRWCLERLPTVKEGYTLDLDSTSLLHEDGHQEGVAVGYTRVGLKPLFASAFGHAGGSALGGATVVAARQCFLWQQRHGVLFGFVGKFAQPHSLGRRAGRLRFLPAGTAGLVGTVTPALRGGGATEPAHPAASAQRLGLDPNRSAGDGSGYWIF